MVCDAGRAGDRPARGSNMTYSPNALKRWTKPDNYFGASWPVYFSSGVGQSGDSDAEERSRFDSMLAALGGETETVKVIRESHWKFHWIEWIAIHESDDKALEISDGIVARIGIKTRLVLDDPSATSPKL